MSNTFAILLSAHVILGIVGLVASFAVTLNLFRKNGSIKRRMMWAWAAFASYIVSWFSGGYYYWFYYGDFVKPSIKEGTYPWAHLVFMEFKEHAFLFLPVATFALAVAVTKVTEERHPELLGSVKTLAVIITIIATIVTLSGIIISGSAR